MIYAVIENVCFVILEATPGLTNVVAITADATFFRVSVGVFCFFFLIGFCSAR